MTAEPAQTPTGRRRAAFIFIFLTVMFDMLALGIIIPVLPKLIIDLIGGDIAQATRIGSEMGTLWAVMQFFFAPVQGALSDRFGRRPIVLLSNFGLGLDYIVMALAPNLAWLFVGRLISGMTSASISTAGAYIADVTPPEKRAGAFGMLGAAFGIGFVLGPAFGGWLGHSDPRLPFWVAAGLSLTNGLYGLLILPESLSRDRRAPFSWKRANPVGSLNLLRRQPALLGLAAIFFLYYLAHQSLPSIFVYYARYRYGWDTATVGMTLAGVGVCSMIVQGGLVRPVVARLGERRTLIIGLIAGAIGFCIYGLAARGEIFWIGLPIMALWGLATPAAQGLMTRKVAATEQGRLQGALGCIMGITGIIGPSLFGRTFAASIDPAYGIALPGAAFVLAGVLLAIAVVIAWKVAEAPQPTAVPAQ